MVSLGASRWPPQNIVRYMVGGIRYGGQEAMLKPRLRFSGWHIPFEHWGDHPCWEFAGDEESQEGQDETTMRPCAEPLITEDTAAAAAYAFSAAGERFPAMVALHYPNRDSAKRIMIFVDGKFDGRRAELSMRKGRWSERKSAPSWFPTWTSAKFQNGLLPVRIVTRAADKRTQRPMSFTVAEVD